MTAVIKIRFDAVDEHTRSPIVACRVIKRLGYNHDAGVHAAIVEHNGKELKVVRIMEGVWWPWSVRDRVAVSGAVRVGWAT